MPPQVELSYPAQEVRKYDRDRFLTGLFAPADRRESLYAVYAFNLELAKVREAVSEPMMGQIRLQWWRETVEEIYQGGGRAHQVAEPLAQAIRSHNLSLGTIERMLEARERDLDDTLIADVAELEIYAEGTSATVTSLALEVLDVRGEAEQAAGHHVGIAWALTGLLRAVPFHARAGRVLLPEGLLHQYGVDPADIMAGKPPAQLPSVVERIALRALYHLKEARSHRRSVQRRAIPALLPAILAEAYLKRLAKRGYDVWQIEVPQPRPLRLATAAALRRY